MSQTIRPSDWKAFRRLHAIALERFSERVLLEIGRLASDDSKTAHQRYLAVYRLVKQRDEELADTFDNTGRSAATRQLAAMRRLELLSDEELSQFSLGTREEVAMILSLSHH